MTSPPADLFVFSSEAGAGHRLVPCVVRSSKARPARFEDGVLTKVRCALPLLSMAVLCVWAGCSAEQASTTCGEAECRSLCQSESSAKVSGLAAQPFGLTVEQAAFLEPMADDISAGVRSWDDTSTGVCQGRGKSCEGFLGLAPQGPLPEGQYMLRAEFRVPKIGPPGTWKVKFDLECEVEDGDSKRSYSRSKTYDLRWAGADRGYRLSPLQTIQAPRKSGTETCRYSLTGLGPTTKEPIEGSWVVASAADTPPPVEREGSEETTSSPDE